MKHTAALLTCALCTAFLAGAVYAQSDDELFGDDTVVEQNAAETPSAESGTGAQTSEKDSLAHGTIFQNGAVKVGGQFTMSMTTLTTFRDGETFGDSLSNTILSPVADGLFTIDARPSQNLRMFFKGGIHYPYMTETDAVTGKITMTTADVLSALQNKSSLTESEQQQLMQNLFYVKELFADFAVKDTAYFRFGKQTITWGTGYFFSPSSNTVNLSAIDPEDTTKQVEGPLALRTQITFPGSQNCLWAYMIPDANLFTFNSASYTYAKNTAFALRGDIVAGGWEFGAGGYYRNEHAPRGIFTASGTLFNKIAVFGEYVYAYGTETEWSKQSGWDGKTSVFQATAGGTYTWKEPQITFAAQYYYDGNGDDAFNKATHGHNAAGLVSFAKVFTTDITASVFGNVNFTEKTATASAMLFYSPVTELKLGAGPYVIWTSFDDKPQAAVKLSAELVGGKF